jgi:hypothetical protein
MTLSTMGGIGGGGAVVPFTMMFFSFTTKEAIAISGFSIFICSLARYIYTYSDKHPEKDAVIIDYGLASIMLPAVMMGSMVGVLANVMLPSLVLQTSLTLLLIFLTIQSGGKARQIYTKENAKLAKERADAAERKLIPPKHEETMEQKLSRLTYKNGGHKVQIGQKITIDTAKKQIIHRYASVPIFDKFDYEKKLEQAIQRNYFENNYDYYLYRHLKPEKKELELQPVTSPLPLPKFGGVE